MGKWRIAQISEIYGISRVAEAHAFMGIILWGDLFKIFPQEFRNFGGFMRKKEHVQETCHGEWSPKKKIDTETFWNSKIFRFEWN